MLSSLQAAQVAAASASSIGADLGAAAAVAASHELHSAVARPSAAVSASPDGAAANEAFLKQHNVAVSHSASAGRSAGETIGEGVGALLLALTLHLGARQCDQCGADSLYHYMSCTTASCARTRPATAVSPSSHSSGRSSSPPPATPPGFDLCFRCYEQFQAGKGSHDHSHTFREHHNGRESGKLLALLVCCLIVAKWLLTRIF